MPQPNDLSRSLVALDLGLARRNAQWHIRFRRRRSALDAPLLCITPDRVVAALVAKPTTVCLPAQSR
jgi:hypothetical protein